MDTIGVDWVGGGAGLDVSWWRWTISSFRVSMDTEPPLISFAMCIAWVHAASGSVRGKAAGIGDGGSVMSSSVMSGSVMSMDPSSDPKSSAVASSPSSTTNLMCLRSGRGVCLGAMGLSSVSVSTAMAARASSPLLSGGTGSSGAAAAAAAASAAAASFSRGCGSVSRSRYSTRPSFSSSLMSR